MFTRHIQHIHVVLKFIGGAAKVKAFGPGLEVGHVNKPCEFLVYSREAGAGEMSIAIEGPAKAEIEFQEEQVANSNVTYRVSQPGKLRILTELSKPALGISYSILHFCFCSKMLKR